MYNIFGKLHLWLYTYMYLIATMQFSVSLHLALQNFESCGSTNKFLTSALKRILFCLLMKYI